MGQRSIWTIGHSSHTIERFIALLQHHDIQVLADVRSKPGSRIHTQFNQAAFSSALAGAGIQYVHFADLGGKRSDMASYTAHMHTDAFKNGITQLEALAQMQGVAYMCAEALWWQCHRAKISDHLFAKGWQVLHIMGNNRVMAHKGAVKKMVQGSLF